MNEQSMLESWRSLESNEVDGMEQTFLIFVRTVNPAFRDLSSTLTFST